MAETRLTVVRKVGQKTPSTITSREALRKDGISATRYGEITMGGMGAITLAMG